MPSSRLLMSLSTDVARLHAVAVQDLTAPVPTCPAWVVDDLVRHVANGLRNVALRRVLGQDPILEPSTTEADPLVTLERAHADLVAELRTRPLDELAGQPPANAYTPAETAYFWLRRMTHEVAVHRADAELVQHEPVTAVPRDLAVDGITEMLELFLRYGSHENPSRYTDLLTDWGTKRLLLTTGDSRWQIRVTPAGVDTTMAADTDDASATVHGEPTALLMWLYNRGDDITMSGDLELTTRTRALLDRAVS
jgi:uncharacterized protein (TIGR03083 family)